MTPDTMSQCDECIHCKSEGFRQVGSYESGGPEEFFSCNKGHNPSIHTNSARAGRRCPSRESRFDEEVW